MRCLFTVVCSLLIVVCCFMIVVFCVLCAVRRQVFVAGSASSDVWFELSGVGCWLAGVCWWLFWLFAVCCLLYGAWCF